MRKLIRQRPPNATATGEELFDEHREQLLKQPYWLQEMVSRLLTEARQSKKERDKFEARLASIDNPTIEDATLSYQLDDGARTDIPLDAVVLARVEGDELDLMVEDGELRVLATGDMYVRPISTCEVVIGAWTKETKK